MAADSRAVAVTLSRPLTDWRIACAVAAFALWPALACAAEAPSATPFRPDVAAGAALSEPGWLDVEFGVQRLGGTGTPRRDSLPYLAKLAFSEDWGVSLGGEARVRTGPSGGPSLRGGGDTVLTLKHRAASGDDSAFGVEAGIKLPTAKNGLGSGKRDYSLLGIYSADLDGGWHIDANLGAVRLGAADPGQGRNQGLWALGASYALGPKWSLATDISGSAQRGTTAASQWLGAVSYSWSKRVVLDFGLARGLSDAAPKRSVFAGMTVLLGKLF